MRDAGQGSGPVEVVERYTEAAQRRRDEPPGQPSLVSRQTRHLAGRVGSIELLGSRDRPSHREDFLAAFRTFLLTTQ